jgi:hypothetical protein
VGVKMEVRNVRWVGIYTHHYREMVRLLRDTMGRHGTSVVVYVVERD